MVIAHRRGALERVALLLGDWRETHRRLADTETRMLAVLNELQLTELVTSITGLSAIGAASILAECRRSWPARSGSAAERWWAEPLLVMTAPSPSAGTADGTGTAAEVVGRCPTEPGIPARAGAR